MGNCSLQWGVSSFALPGFQISARRLLFIGAILFFVTNRLKLFLPFKRELQTANATVRPWSRDIFRFAVSHEKSDAKDVY